MAIWRPDFGRRSVFLDALFPERWIEHLLAQTNGLGRHFDQLVFLDVGDGLFEGRAARRGEADGLVLARGPHIGELLGFYRVDVEVVASAVFADDHALIGLFT